MPLDPHFAAMLEAVNAHEGPSSFSGTPQEMRDRLTAVLTAHQDRSSFAPVASVRAVDVGGVGTLVIHPRPSDGEVLPTVAYLHPGGFATGSAELFEDVARQLARDLDSVVVSIDYPLAPEHRPPVSTQAVVDVVGWIVDNRTELGGANGPVGLVGESSGANLAAAAAICLRDEGVPITAQLLICPFADLGRTFPSERALAQGYFISQQDLEDIRRLVLADPEDGRQFPASPARASDLRNVAPAVVAVAEYDPLRDDGISYAGLLLQAGVPTLLRSYDGLIHPFFGMASVSPAAAAARDDLCARFASALRSASPTAPFPTI